jgi:hypothetical protein
MEPSASRRRRLDPKTRIASNKSRRHGRMALGPKTSLLALLCRRSSPFVEGVRRPLLLGVTSCRPRPVADSIRRPNLLPGMADCLGCVSDWSRRSISVNSQLRPRLWHKVEHVHPGALRGRAVGSAPSIRRTLVNGPSLALQSRLQRLRDAHRSPRPAPPK